MTDQNPYSVTTPASSPSQAPPPLPEMSNDLDSGRPAPLGAKKDIEITHVIYGLMAAGYVTGGLGTLAAIILNYIKLDEVKGTPLEGHFRWQMRTFWWGMLWAVLSMLLMFVLVGFFTIFVVIVWHIYRIAKGWMRLNDGKQMDL